ncbi:hypothetical protein DMENIID0001_089190 [Sergentomyia squamirostris]
MFHVLGTFSDGERVSAARGFLLPAMNRSNLNIVKYAHVENLVIDDNGVLSGVNLRGEQKFAVTAKQEVILSQVDLRSADPADKPRIFANYLSDEADLELFLKTIRHYFQFLNTETFTKHEIEFFNIPLPECDVLEFDIDEYLICYIRHMTSTALHPVGTAKMGPDSDPDAVVDCKLKVKGTTGLRVIDASIMPVIPRGNTNAPTIMVAEKGADFVKEDCSFTHVHE